RRDPELLSIAQDARFRGEIRGERLHRALCLELLDEGEDRVDEDHDDDRNGDGDDACNPRENGRGPEEEGKRMGELAPEVAEMAALLTPAYLVWAVLLE